jgi:hypothetical protein
VSLDDRQPMRRCGHRYDTKQDAEGSKRGQQPGAAFVQCCMRNCNGWHVELPTEPRKPLRARSKKTERIYIDRRELVAELLEAQPWCQIRWDDDCGARATDVHEPGMRSRGADILDPDQCVTGCRHCHDMVHANPAEATDRGWMIPSGQGQSAA